MNTSDVMTRFRQKAGDRADEVLSQVQQCPEYFIDEGGADGTFGHVLFLADFGELMPEIIEIANSLPPSSQKL